MALGVALSLAAAAARADDAGSATAERAFREGRALMDQGSYAEACKRFAESQRLEPKLGTLANLAYCHERAGKSATAWREYEKVLAEARAARDEMRINFASDRLVELTPNLAKLLLHTEQSTPTLSVTIDDDSLGPNVFDVAFPIDPGQYSLVVTAPGKTPWRKTLRIAPGASMVLVTVPELADEAPPRTERPAREQPSSTMSARASSGEASAASNLRATLGWSAATVGAVGIALGSYYGLHAFAQKREAEGVCRGDACPQAGLDLYGDMKASETVSSVAFGAGLVALGAGAYLLLTHRASGRAASTRWFAPALGGAAGGAFGGDF
jgi:hypothetical protein